MCQIDVLYGKSLIIDFLDNFLKKRTALKNNAKNNAKNDAKNKRLKVFRLNAAILSLQFVNLLMFYCSLFLLGTSCNLLSSVPVVP